MDKYLLEILKEVNTIIIPGLGALTITDAETGDIMFMPYLKHDDGELSKYIANKEGMELNDAVNLIAKYVREILNTLDKGESYDMFQFGSFVKNESGDIEFKMWNSDNPVEDSVTESTVVDTSKENTPQPEIEEEKLPEVDTPIEEESVSDETNTSEEPLTEESVNEEPVETQPVEQEPVKPIVANSENEAQEPAEKEPLEQKKEVERELNILEKEERAATQARLDKLREDKNKPQKKRRGAGFYVLIIFGLIIISFSSYVIIDFEGASKLMPFLASEETNSSEEHSALDEMEEILGKTQEEAVEAYTSSAETNEGTEEEVTEETPEIKEEVKEEPAPKVEKKEPMPVPTNSATGYHIIAGSFGNPANAERFAAKLRDQGASATLIQENGLYKVSLGSYASRDEAKAALSNLNLSVDAIIHKVD